MPILILFFCSIVAIIAWEPGEYVSDSLNISPLGNFTSNKWILSYLYKISPSGPIKNDLLAILCSSFIGNEPIKIYILLFFVKFYLPLCFN